MLEQHLDLKQEGEAAFGHAARLDEPQVRELKLLAVRPLLAAARVLQLRSRNDVT
jgi:hypothetical protein